MDYTFLKKMKFKLGYGVHYQFVKQIIGENVTSRSRDFWLLSEDNNVKVGKSTHYVAGLSYERDAWLINSEIFYKDIENLTEFSLRYRNTGIRSLFFTGTGTVKGFETLLQKKIEK